MEDNKEVKNFYYVKGNQNNYTINMGEHSSLKLFGDNEEILDIDSMTEEAESCAELESSEAKEIFAKLRKAGILDKNDMPNRLSWAKRGTLAWLIAGRLKIENQWAVFGKRWNMNKESLRKGYNEANKQPKMQDFIGLINDAIR